jgi:hypothetical protein
MAMQVSNVSTGYADPAALGKRSEPAESSGIRSKLGDMLGSVTGGKKASAADIVAQYDVTHITPTQFSQMVQKLYHSGALSDAEFQELSAVRLDLETAGIQPDEKINLRQFYADKVKDIEQQQSADPSGQPASQQNMEPVLRRFQWVEKFAVMQSSPDGAGVDAVA